MICAWGRNLLPALTAWMRTRIKSFAAEFDPQPFHLDEAAARQSVFRGLAASGWHTAAATMRLMVTSGLPFAGGFVGLGGEIPGARPTRPGDTLRVESEILAIIPSRSKPNQGVVTVRNVTLNQNGEEAQVLVTKILALQHVTIREPQPPCVAPASRRRCCECVSSRKPPGKMPALPNRRRALVIWISHSY